MCSYMARETVSMYLSINVEYNLGNPTSEYMGPRYRRLIENDGLLVKLVTNLLLFFYGTANGKSK
jgi:hypothetical protein